MSNVKLLLLFCLLLDFECTVRGSRLLCDRRVGVQAVVLQRSVIVKDVLLTSKSTLACAGADILAAVGTCRRRSAWAVTRDWRRNR